MNAARKLRTIARTAGDTMGPGSSAVFARSRPRARPGMRAVRGRRRAHPDRAQDHLPQQVPRAHRRQRHRGPGVHQALQDSGRRQRPAHAGHARRRAAAPRPRAPRTGCASCSPGIPTSRRSSAPSTTARSIASSASPGTTRSCRTCSPRRSPSAPGCWTATARSSPRPSGSTPRFSCSTTSARCIRP